MEVGLLGTWNRWLLGQSLIRQVRLQYRDGIIIGSCKRMNRGVNISGKSRCWRAPLHLTFFVPCFTSSSTCYYTSLRYHCTVQPGELTYSFASARRNSCYTGLTRGRALWALRNPCIGSPDDRGGSRSFVIPRTCSLDVKSNYRVVDDIQLHDHPGWSLSFSSKKTCFVYTLLYP